MKISRLDIEHLSKSFGQRQVLSNLSLSSSTGEILGIFGRNGSGKSTLLKSVFGTLRPNSIQIRLNGVIVKHSDVIPKHLIAYLPQDNFLPKTMKVRDVIPLFYAGNDQDKIFYAPSVDKISNTKIGNLSMGELRYLEVLLISNLQHPFLLLDEPFSMVEPLYKDHILDLLLRTRMTKGIIVTDHYYRDVLSVSDRNIIIKDGSASDVINVLQLIRAGYLPE